ncbi:hypothetical protein [Actinoplanes sp. URMC 104]|uniref:hypothetical protein n=1 Tax=Actinoplanes sp. URMC 104 TaxID=3423409 RepID=UPI003F1B3A0C
MILFWYSRHTYRGRRWYAATPTVPEPSAGSWPVEYRRPDNVPAGDETRELAHAVTGALAGSGPGDLLYLVETACRHTAAAVGALVQGLTRTDADYVAVHDDVRDYGESDATVDGTAPAGALAAVMSDDYVWHRRSCLGRSFGCRRGVWERDQDIVLDWLAGAGDVPAWDRLWAALSARGRVLRAVSPAMASPSVPGEQSPSLPPTTPIGPVPAAAGVPAADFWARPSPAQIAVLPAVSAGFCAELARLRPGARLTPVAGVEALDDTDAGCVAVTIGDKEKLDDFLRFRRHGVTAVVVELTESDPARTVRWISGRDWLLPAAAAEASPWIV